MVIRLALQECAEDGALTAVFINTPFFRVLGRRLEPRDHRNMRMLATILTAILAFTPLAMATIGPRGLLRQMPEGVLIGFSILTVGILMVLSWRVVVRPVEKWCGRRIEALERAWQFRNCRASALCVVSRGDEASRYLAGLLKPLRWLNRLRMNWTLMFVIANGLMLAVLSTEKGASDFRVAENAGVRG
jgi:hypothetical protein